MRHRLKVLRASDRPVTVFEQATVFEDIDEIILRVIRTAQQPLKPGELVSKVEELTTDWCPVSISACMGRMIQHGSLVYLQQGLIQEGDS